MPGGLAAEEQLLDPNQINAPGMPAYLSIFTSLWKKLGRDERADLLQSAVTRLYQNEQPPPRPKQPILLESASSLAELSCSDFGPYLADLERRIKRAWFPPSGTEQKLIQVIFLANSHGNLCEQQLSRSCGAVLADQAAMKAIERAAPFKKLPEGTKEFERFEVTFNYRFYTRGGGSVRRL